MKISKAIGVKTKFNEKQFEIGNTYYYIMQDDTSVIYKKLGELLQVVNNKFKPSSILFFDTNSVDIKSMISDSDNTISLPEITNIVSEDIVELNKQLYHTIEYCDNKPIEDITSAGCTVVVFPYRKFRSVMLKGTKEDTNKVVISSFKYLSKVCEQRNVIFITISKFI